MTSQHREVLAATFYKFLLKNIGTVYKRVLSFMAHSHSYNAHVFVCLFIFCFFLSSGGSEKFQDKQKFFYSEVKKMRGHLTRGEINVKISRHNILEEVPVAPLSLYKLLFSHQAMQATRHFSSSDWYKKFYIEFQGEEGTVCVHVHVHTCILCILMYMYGV